MQNGLEALPLYSPIIALALAIVVFALAPLVIYLISGKEITKRGFFVLIIECGWLLLANAICALSTVGYFFRKYGSDWGLLLSLLTTAFGGTIALGIYEAILTQRLALGRTIQKKVFSFLAAKVERDREDGGT